MENKIREKNKIKKKQNPKTQIICFQLQALVIHKAWPNALCDFYPAPMPSYNCCTVLIRWNRTNPVTYGTNSFESYESTGYMSHKSCNIVQIWTTGLDPQHRLSYKFGLHVHARPQHFVSIANVSIYRSIVQIRANPSYKFTNPAVMYHSNTDPR